MSKVLITFDDGSTEEHVPDKGTLGLYKSYATDREHPTRPGYIVASWERHEVSWIEGYIDRPHPADQANTSTEKST